MISAPLTREVQTPRASAAEPSGDRFAVTRWSVVLLAHPRCFSMSAAFVLAVIIAVRAALSRATVTFAFALMIATLAALVAAALADGAAIGADADITERYRHR